MDYDEIFVGLFIGVAGYLIFDFLAELFLGWWLLVAVKWVFIVTAAIWAVALVVKVFAYFFGK